MKIKLLITGRSYDSAGNIPTEIELEAGCSLDEAIQSIEKLLPEGSKLSGNCLLSISGQHLGTLSNHGDHALKEDDEIALISPVAGG